jgi:dTMP kinase
MSLAEKHPYPGKLIIVEGIDGSGKTTQLQLLGKWLQSRGEKVFLTEWNSSLLVKRATRRGKRRNELTPTTFSLLHATDFADRLFYRILPPLKAGMMVLADRYAYTAFARDVARGVSREWVHNLYDFAIKPDVTFYFKVSAQKALERLISGRAKLKYHEAGMDLELSDDIEESFLLFQTRVLEEYDRMSSEFQFQVMDATQSIDRQQRLVRRLVS